MWLDHKERQRWVTEAAQINEQLTSERLSNGRGERR
jgi:hypothetical protein